MWANAIYLCVFASAIGPAAFSVGLDVFGSYDVVIKICLALLVCLLVYAILLKQDEMF